MEKINLDATALAKLLQANSLRKPASDKLRQLIMETESKSSIYIKIKLDRLLICEAGKNPKFEKCQHEWPRIDDITIEFSLEPDHYFFSFKSKIHLHGTSGTYMAANTSAPIDQIEFDGEKKMMRLWDEFHTFPLFFKRKRDFDFMKNLIQEIKTETEEIIKILHEH